MAETLSRAVRLFLEGGPVMVAIALVSLGAWILIWGKWMELRRMEGYRAGLQDGVWNVREWMASVLEGDRGGEAEARAIARGELRSILGRLLRAERCAAMRWLGLLGVLAGVLPLLGLLGTVLGMIATFEAIGSRGMTEPRLIAGGIRQALLTTQTGLLAAVPVLVCARHLRSRARRLVEGLELDLHRSCSTHGCGREE